MRKNWSLISGLIILTVVIGGMVSGRVIASDPQRVVPGGLNSIDPKALTLKESVDAVSWEPIIGDLALGYSMVLDPANTYEYLDIATLEAAPALADGYHEFFFDAFRAPDGFWGYWAAKGVVEGSTGWQGAMWGIISGDQPMFYLNVSGSTYHLIDGFQKQFESVDAPLRVNGDYPLGTYHFGGWVTDTGSGSEYLNIQITFTKVATVAISPQSSTIEGCGYVDVYIHLENVHDLYAVDVALSFDPTVMEVVDMDDTADGVNLEPISTFFNAAYWVYNDADNTTGTIQYTATQLNTTSPVNGEGDVAMIRFRAKSIGESDITITKAELSDRDGFLVGRPVDYEDPAATITTQFATADGLDLDIIRLDNANVQLSWPKQTLDANADYFLYRSTLPYFNIGDPEVALMTQSLYDDTGDPITYTDEVLGDVVNNYFYTLEVDCSNGFTSPPSWQVGKFEFELFESNTTDFGWVGLVLENDDIVNTQDLANDIEGHIYSGTVDVKTISRWNASGQIFTTYDHATGGGKFDVFVKQPYRIEIDIVGASSGNAIWAQVGQLPEITQDTYTLYETATTDYTWVLQPLDMVNITSMTQLAESIEANSSAGITVDSIARWNGTGQTFSSYVRPANSTTRFGYPYRIEANVTDGSTVTWP